MSEDICYLCGKAIPSGQSFYEGHDQKVCLTCFRSTKRCVKCQFPSNHLKMVDGFGTVCEFCYQGFSKEKEKGMTCYLCNTKIWSNASFYSGQGKKVCQNCFKKAAVRCFSCRFPHVVEKVSGLGGICEFCKEVNLTSQSNIEPLFVPLRKFLIGYGHDVKKKPTLLWVHWKLILGMQQDELSEQKIKFFDDLIRYCYPVYQLKNVFYVIPSIPQQWFMPFMAGQLVAADLCGKYKLSHLKGNSPFQELARGWCHWIAYCTATVLKQDKVAKSISRWPESSMSGNFSKFLAMSEFRKPKEIVVFAHQNLKEYAGKYL